MSKERVEILTITPAVAKVLLTGNGGNRKIRSTVIETIRGAISSGDMLLSPDAIAVTGNSVRDHGRLLNGQHRLTACVDSGTPFRAIVYFGAESSVFDVCDRQSRRTSADAISARGVANAKTVAAVARLVSAYGGRTQMEPREVCKFLEDWPDLTDFVSANLTDARVVTNNPASLLAALYVCSSGDHEREADTFRHQVLSGEGLSKGNPALTLRNRLIDLKGKAHREQEGITFSGALYAFTYALRAKPLLKLYPPASMPLVVGSPFWRAAA